MATYDIASITNKLTSSATRVYTKNILKSFLDVKSDSTLDKIIRRLITSQVITRSERGKYLIRSGHLHLYTIANFLRSPSYISFESALNHHGILSQFPYEVSSVTPLKSGEKEIQDVAYTYIHLTKSLYWGYYKEGDYLIAEPEKALLDQLYLHLKGLRGFPLDEYDLERINVIKLKKYLKLMPKVVRSHTLAIQLVKESGYDRPVAII